MNRFITLACLYFLYSTVLSAQTCVNSIVPTIDLSNYELNDNGSITDLNNKLMWSRCAAGQSWQEGKCIGEALLNTWDEARALAKASTMFSFNDWRLPSIDELSAITELSCQNPAINLVLFPNTPSLSYWTATEFINDKNFAWQVYFGSGENHTTKKSTLSAIRLVRSVKNNN